MRLISAHEISDTKLEKPFRLIVGGGSGTGKTTFVKDLVDKNHFSSPFEKIVYCYPDYLEEIPVEFDQIVEYQPGLCGINYFTSLPKNTLIICDDLMNECGNSNDIMKLFSVIARKRNLSIIFLVQNIYDNSKQFRNIRLNATGFILFKFYASIDVTKRLIRDIGVQSLVSKRHLEDIYSKNFAYIFVNIHPERQNPFVAVTTNIFDKYYSIFHKMEYVAIPKSDFLKYFKVVEAKKGTIKAIKNEIEVRSGKKKRTRNAGSTERSKRSKRRSTSPSSSSTTSQYTESD